MLRTYTTNLKCQSCLSKVRSFLDNEPVIERWSVDLKSPQKMLRVELDDGADESRIPLLLNEAGFDASLVTAEPQAKEMSPRQAFKLATYKPLFLVVAYVIGATALAESIHGTFAWVRAMSYFMGFFFLGFAFFKLLNIPAFADAFATYDIVARRSRGYALSYPWIELTLGTLFVYGALPLLTNGITALVMAVGLIGVVAVVRKKQTIQCACLGTAFNLPMSVVTIIENSVMLLMATIMLIREFLT